MGLWYYLIKINGMETSLARGYVMALMIIIQNIHAFNCRSEKKSTFTIPVGSNPIFIVGVIGSVLLGLAVMEIPFLSVFLKTHSIPFVHLEMLFLLGTIIFIVMELYKLFRYHLNNK